MELSIFGNRRLELKKSIDFLDTHLVNKQNSTQGAITSSLGVFYEIITDDDYLTLKKGIHVSKIDSFNILLQQWLTSYRKYAMKKISFSDWIEGNYSDQIKWRMIFTVLQLIEKDNHTIKFNDKLVKFSSIKGSLYLYHNPMLLYTIVLGLQGFFIECYSLNNKGLK